MSEKLITIKDTDLNKILGSNNSKFDKIKKLFPHVKLISRGDKLKIVGAKKEINHFIDCIRHKKTPEVSGFDGLMSLVLGLCAKESLNCNKPVLVSKFDKI